MSKLLYSVAFFLLASCSATISPDLNGDWIIGDWVRISDQDSVVLVESWQKTDNGFKATEKVSSNGECSITEIMELVKQKNGWVFIAHPKENATPTKFKVVEASKNSFVCINEQHDFPKCIEYRLSGNTLFAFIGNDKNENGKTFIFTRQNNNLTLSE
ncbi:MAG: hypothetical protein H6607_09400 [Flavobacteriales bacterium]|nr:hypothetical protein [Flavobacteriales bacterium]